MYTLADTCMCFSVKTNFYMFTNFTKALRSLGRPDQMDQTESPSPCCQRSIFRRKLSFHHLHFFFYIYIHTYIHTDVHDAHFFATLPMYYSRCRVHQSNSLSTCKVLQEVQHWSYKWFNLIISSSMFHVAVCYLQETTLFPLALQSVKFIGTEPTTCQATEVSFARATLLRAVKAPARKP